MQNPKFHLRAVWSRSQETAESFNLEVAGCSLEAFWSEDGFEELLARTDIEAFVVVLPPAAQPVYITRLLQKGKHVLSEKPVAPDRQAAQQILQRLEGDVRYPAVWCVSDNLRHEPVFCAAQQHFVEISPVNAAEMHAVIIVAPGEASGGGPRSDEELWIEGAVQHVSVLRSLLGQITEVNCWRASEHLLDSSDQPLRGTFWKDSLSGTLRFESGAVCVLSWQTSYNQEDRRLRLVLSGRGHVEIELDSGQLLHGIQRFALRTLGQGLAYMDAVGPQQQVEEWGQAIRAFDESGACGSPLHAVVDLMVVCAMLQSGGSNVQIREKPKRAT